MKKNIYTLIPDIHKLLEDGKEGVNEKNLREFFKALREDVESFLSPDNRDNSGRLRMSAIGKHDRKLWYEFNNKETKKFG